MLIRNSLTDRYVLFGGTHFRRLYKEQLAGGPKYFSKKHVHLLQKRLLHQRGGGGDNICSLCFNDLAIRDRVRTCENGHFACIDCLSRHANQTMAMDLDPTCPFCRSELQVDPGVSDRVAQNLALFDMQVDLYVVRNPDHPIIRSRSSASSGVADLQEEYVKHVVGQKLADALEVSLDYVGAGIVSIKPEVMHSNDPFGDNDIVHEIEVDFQVIATEPNVDRNTQIADDVRIAFECLVLTYQSFDPAEIESKPLFTFHAPNHDAWLWKIVLLRSEPF